jgi:7,8-dihydropterin-6-yl-methyl-4-(beta-D-ribofuranosyl)aminobenzene 5'-phosphate synthase
MRRSSSAVFLCVVLAAAVPVRAAAGQRVKALKITVLSTMLADRGIGEWGFAALVEVDGRRILFDTGARPRTVLENARELKVDLATVTDVVLSHNHDDHTGGLLTLRRELARTRPTALARIHVGAGIFLSRPGEGGEGNSMIAARRELEATGATILVHEGPEEIAPGVWVTGPVPRVHPERNYPPGGKVVVGKKLVEDNVPEDMSLVFDTDQGLVLLSGCGHAGVVNTVEPVRKAVRAAPLLAAIGGFHLFALDDAAVAWTAGELARAGLVWFIGAHCTGIEAVYRIRELARLDRRHAVVGAVGASFRLGEGIDPLALAR